MSAISLRNVRFDSVTGKLARNIASSERLSALLPQDEVNELLAAYDAATKTVAAARKLRPELPDVFAKLDGQFREGKPADVSKLVSELAKVQAEQDQAQRTIDALAAIPDRYRAELERLINDSADGFIERLDEQLQELLNEAETVLKAMPGVHDAESAIRAGKHAEWARWLSLHEAYIALRRDHLEILRATADNASNFAPGRPALGFAFFRNFDGALPDFVHAMEDGGATRARLPFNVVDPADPGHWMATVAERARLEPAAEYADEAVNQAGEATLRHLAETDPGNPAPKRRDDLGGTGWQGAAMFGTPREKHHATR